MKKRFLVLIPLLALALTGCNFSLAADITPPPGYRSPTPPPTLGPIYPSAPPDPAAGAAIYAEKCAPCHGLEGMGDGEQGKALPVRVAPIGLTELMRPAVPADWFVLVSQGNIERYMPPFQSLSEQQRWDVLAYVYTLSMSEFDTERGEILYTENCASCHGVDGRGVNNVQFTDQALMAKLSDQDLFDVISMGIEPSMPAYQDALTDDARWAVVSYVRTFTFATASQPEAAPDQPTLTPEPVSTDDSAITPEAGEVPAEEATPEAVATPDGLGTVSGAVLNGSGGPIPAGLTVVLTAFDADMATGGFQPVLDRSTTVEADGSYAFADVELPANRAFLVTLMYDGVQYSSSPVITAGGEDAVDVLPFTFYKTSTDVSALNVSRWHIFVNFGPDGKTMQVVELVIVNNTSVRTVAPAAGGKPLLVYSLPAGAENLQFDDSDLPGRFVTGEGTLGDLAPVLPGAEQHQVVFVYTLPYNNKLDLTRSLPLGADSVTVMVPDGVKVKSDFLAQGETRDFQGTTYTLYNGNALPAQGQLSFTISGRPGGGLAVKWSAGSNAGLMIGAGLLGLALILAGVFLYWRERQSGEEDLDEIEEQPEFDGTDSVMDAIIALDDLHRAGKIPDEVYQQRRDELKATLKDLMGES